MKVVKMVLCAGSGELHKLVQNACPAESTSSLDTQGNGKRVSPTLLKRVRKL